MSALAIGALSLTPAFDPDTLVYTASTSNATNTITAEAVKADTSVSIDVNGATVNNGSPATWQSGENIVTVTAANGGSVTIYQITVTKSAG